MKFFWLNVLSMSVLGVSNCNPKDVTSNRLSFSCDATCCDSLNNGFGKCSTSSLCYNILAADTNIKRNCPQEVPAKRCGIQGGYSYFDCGFNTSCVLGYCKEDTAWPVVEAKSACRDGDFLNVRMPSNNEIQRVYCNPDSNLLPCPNLYIFTLPFWSYTTKIANRCKDKGPDKNPIYATVFCGTIGSSTVLCPIGQTCSLLGFCESTTTPENLQHNIPEVPIGCQPNGSIRCGVYGGVSFLCNSGYRCSKFGFCTNQSLDQLSFPTGENICSADIKCGLLGGYFYQCQAGECCNQFGVCKTSCTEETKTPSCQNVQFQYNCGVRDGTLRFCPDIKQYCVNGKCQAEYASGKINFPNLAASRAYKPPNPKIPCGRIGDTQSFCSDETKPCCNQFGHCVEYYPWPLSSLNKPFGHRICGGTGNTKRSLDAVRD